MRRIVTDLQGKKRRYIDFELDPEEYAALGRVTVQWAHLEHVMFAHTSGIAETVSVDLPRDALSTSFKRRLSAFRALVANYAPASEMKRIDRLISKIANAEQDRHKLTHGLWDWSSDDPDSLVASSFRPSYEFETRFDAARIDELATRIGEISFELEYPGGMEDVFRERFGDSGAGSFIMSREGRRALMGKARSFPLHSTNGKPEEGD